MAWLIPVLKLGDDSDIAQIIISDSSESGGKQMKVPFCRNHGCFGGLWFHWKWTSLAVHGKNMSWSCDSLIHWKAWQIGYVPAFPVPLIFPRLSRTNGYASMPALSVLKVMLRVSGRVFKLSCSLTLLPLHILVTPRSNLVANEDYTIIGNRGGGFNPCCHSRGFTFHLDLPSRQDTQRTGSGLVLMVY